MVVVVGGARGEGGVKGEERGEYNNININN